MKWLQNKCEWGGHIGHRKLPQNHHNTKKKHKVNILRTNTRERLQHAGKPVESHCCQCETADGLGQGK